ncbi:MAG: glucose-1-phosphate adenylyltransferase family protein [Candidatus Eisenbacteria bacterium]|nr:glucose-1-phosphate adenylyltransferase family protein [Candidatus Eisenbacteria bacterium]
MGLEYAMILAGGMGKRLCLLSEGRAKPAVPFGGKYRIIDFTLSNCVNSGIYDIGILTQYRPGSLHDHIGIGRPWDLDRKNGGVKVLQPYIGWRESDWYSGTADAVYQNLSEVTDRGVKYVLVLSGDHVYSMDYGRLFRCHIRAGAEVTIGVVDVDRSETKHLGMAELDADGKVLGFEEKPESARSLTASMGIYVFTASALIEALKEDSRDEHSRHDFGRDILPVFVKKGTAYGFRFRGYWQDIGTLDSYFRANLDLVHKSSLIKLERGRWVVHTRDLDMPPARFGKKSVARKSIIAGGCVVNGSVTESVLFPGAIVEEGARVTNSIVMNDCWIGPGAILDRVILDKEVHIGNRSVIGAGEEMTPNKECPEHLSSGITIVGKNAILPDGIEVGRNCKIYPGVRPHNFHSAKIASGETIRGELLKLWS